MKTGLIFDHICSRFPDLCLDFERFLSPAFHIAVVGAFCLYMIQSLTKLTSLHLGLIGKQLGF